MKSYEILAPAGSFEALKAAVQTGADAVYLSGKQFGARKFANNFSNEELVQALEYCHIRGVDVYVTVNTLVLNDEFNHLKQYMDFLYTSGVDAVILQDIGVLTYVRKTYPDLEIHCSTQMSAQTVEDIKYLESLGADRVVLGREMTIEDIKRAKEETDLQLEVFIHGSLCISVSGQCLMSSMIGGRSGNRGSCAQPCRQKYSLVNQDTMEKFQSPQGSYLLSPKDLCTIEEIRTIIDAGGFSLKIEGRMKSPEYVATVVNTYRQMIESTYSGKQVDLKALQQDLKIFNRGFTKGHLFGAWGNDFMSMTSPGNQGYYIGKVVDYNFKEKSVSIALESELNHNDEIQIRRKDETIGGRVERLQYKGAIVKSCTKGQVCQVNFKHPCKSQEKVFKTFDEEFMKDARQSFINESLEIPVSIEITIHRGENIIASLSDGKNTVSVESDAPQEAIKRALSPQDVESQLSKLGSTPYSLKSINTILDQGINVSIKQLNSIRRVLVEKLDKIRAKRYHRSSRLPSSFTVPKETKSSKEIQLTFGVTNLAQLDAVLNLEAKTIYYKDLNSLEYAIKLCRERAFQGQLIPEIFKLIPDNQLFDYRDIILKLGLDTVLIQSYGHIGVFNGFKLVADFNLNIVNDLAYDFYNDFFRVTLSPELNMSQMVAMGLDGDRTEIFGYGFLPVMTMKHCVTSTTLSAKHNCGLCNNTSFALMDRKNESFKIVRRYGCNTEIYNSKKHWLVDHYKKLAQAGVGYFRLNFLDEGPDLIEKITIAHRKILTSANPKLPAFLELRDNVTSGHLNRGFE